MQPKSESERPVHVALITPGFPRDESDTACIPALQEYLHGLNEHAPWIEVSVLSLRYPHRMDCYQWHGVDVFPIGARQVRFPMIVPSWLDLMKKFRALHRRSPVNLIHSLWLGECSLLGTILARRYTIPHVITLMGQDGRLKKHYRWLLGTKPNTVVSVSEFQRRDLPARTRNAARLIPWGIGEIASPRVERDIDVLGVGSLIAVKDFVKFLRVAADLKRVKPDLNCVLVGEGSERPALESLARELGLDKTLRFEGAVARERVLELMARARVLLHTASYESYGFVFVEALASGMRIVSSPVGIAEAGPDWAVEETVPRMAAAVERFLSERPPVPSFPYPVEETVRGYSSLFREVINR